MKTRHLVFSSFIAILMATAARASGPMGIYAVIERVVFEPTAEAPERVQIFGAFAFYGGTALEQAAVTDPTRGYMYFRLPGNASDDLVRREWSDLATAAGTGKGVAFGRYGYVGYISDLSASQSKLQASQIQRVFEPGTPSRNVGVRPESEVPEAPAVYAPSDLGVVVLGANHEAILAKLRALLEP